MLPTGALLTFLQKELNFIESGGYREHPQRWFTPLIFEDGPSCLIKTTGESLLCRRCPLLTLVPAEHGSQPVPSRHIVLTEDGQTIDSMYRTANQRELESALRRWLQTQITRLQAAQVLNEKAG